MVETVAMDQMTKHAESVYQAIIMIARRARQINDEQKVMVENEFYDDSNDDFLDEDFEPEQVPAQLESIPKPHTIALEEYLRGEIDIVKTDEDVE